MDFSIVWRYENAINPITVNERCEIIENASRINKESRWMRIRKPLVFTIQSLSLIPRFIREAGFELIQLPE